MHPAFVIVLTSALTAAAFWWAYGPRQLSGGSAGVRGGNGERRVPRTFGDVLEGIPVHPVVVACRAELDSKEVIKVR